MWSIAHFYLACKWPFLKLLTSQPTAMWKSYIKITFRQLSKHKIFSLINLMGLALGMIAFIIIYQYVSFERSFDQFHSKSDQIYRVNHERFIDGEFQYKKAQTFIPTGEAMKDEYPEVLNFTTLFRISAESDILVNVVDESDELIQFNEKRVYHVKGDFFDVFTFPLVEGAKHLKNLESNTVVLSQSMAKKYFGNTSPIGKTISHNYAKNYKVVGVFEDVPSNSHLKFDFLFAWQDVSGEDASNWRNDGFYTYLLLAPGSRESDLEAKFPDFANKYISGNSNENLSSAFSLQPLTSIHLDSDLLAEIEPNNEARLVYAVLAVGLFVLIMAWINFINLTVSKFLDRSKEVGIRKAVGSNRGQLMTQFLTESMLVNGLAFIVACSFLYLLSPYISSLIGDGVDFSLFYPIQNWILPISILVIGSLVAGLYPAILLSSVRPIRALKNYFADLPSRNPFGFKQGLVVFQFVISIVMIAASAIAYRQLTFMKNSSLGIDLTGTIVLNTQATFGPPGSDSLFTQKLGALKDQLISQSNVKGVTATYDIPGKEYLTILPNFRHSKNSDEMVSLYFTRMDSDFIPTFGANLLAGRNFIAGQDTQYSVILNKDALSVLGFESPEDAIGEELNWGNKNLAKAEIVGVVDFRTVSLKESNLPIAYTSTFFPYKYVSVKFDEISGANAEANLQMLQATWERTFPDKPFDFFFLNDLFNSQYNSEQRFGKILSLFTLLAIAVACLGLYGTTSVSISRKVKEVSIRKIMGANLSHLVYIFSKSTLFLIIVSGLISVPLVYFGMGNWLENYPYRIEISALYYLIPVLIIGLITALILGTQILKVSRVNPAQMLKNE